MKTFLLRLADVSETGLEKKAIARLLNSLERNRGYLSYAEAATLKTNIVKLDTKISAAAKFFYCACGGEILRSTVQVPEDLYNLVHIGSPVSQIAPSVVTSDTDLGVAHHAILEHFAIQQSALSRLKPRDILELRADGATQRAVIRLRGIVSEVQAKFERARKFHERRPRSPRGAQEGDSAQSPGTVSEGS